MPWASFSMLDGPGGTHIHIIVQDQDGQNNNKYYNAKLRWRTYQESIDK